jgi:hypothetical protein
MHLCSFGSRPRHMPCAASTPHAGPAHKSKPHSSGCHAGPADGYMPQTPVLKCNTAFGVSPAGNTMQAVQSCRASMQADHKLPDSNAATGQHLLQGAQHATALVSINQHYVHDHQLGANTRHAHSTSAHPSTPHTRTKQLSHHSTLNQGCMDTPYCINSPKTHTRMLSQQTARRICFPPFSCHFQKKMQDRQFSACGPCWMMRQLPLP